MSPSKLTPQSHKVFGFSSLSDLSHFTYLSKLSKSSHLPLFFLLIVSCFLLFYRLNATNLTNWDEAWYASIARNMARSGDFVTITYNGQVWFAASPLYLWLLALWFQLTNYSVLGARFISSLFSLGIIILTYLIGTQLKAKKSGLIAAFILATSIQYLFRSRQGNLDLPLTFFNTLAVWCFLKAKTNVNYYFLMGGAIAGGFLSKNVLGLLPLALLIMIPRKYSLTVLGTFLLAAAPWHIAAYLKYGAAFLNHYFGQYFFTKLTNFNPIAGDSYTWYLTVLKHGLKVWVLLLPIALLFTLKSIYRTKKLLIQHKVLIYWLFIPFILFSTARMKNDWYLIPLYPPLAVFVGLFLTDFYGQIHRHFLKWLYLGLILVAGIFNVAVYWSSFIVPETTAAEVKLASLAKNITRNNESIILDDTYHPVASFYTDRTIIPVRYSRSYEALAAEETLKLATASASLVLTNQQTLNQLATSVHASDYQILSTADDKLLIRLKFEDSPTKDIK